MCLRPTMKKHVCAMDNIKVHQKRIIIALKQARDVCFPMWLRRFPLFRLLQNWIFQGFAGAHWTELLFRFSLEMVVVAALWCALSIWTHYAIVWAVLVAHTLMWTFNGHLWALKISDKARLVRNTPERINKYIVGLEHRLERAQPITACVLSGSLSRGRFHQYSDLDVWFTKKRGFFNGLWAYVLGVRERSIAFLQRIPIELYFYDPEDYVGKDSDETLLLLKDCEGRWRKVELGSVWLKDYPLNEIEFFAAKRGEHDV